MIDKNSVINAAQKYAARGQVDDAIAEWEKLLEVHQDGNIYNTIGDLYLKKGAQEQATASFARAANIFKEDGFYPKAIALFKKILNIVPEELNALVSLAQLNAERGFTNQAVEELQYVANIYVNRGSLDKALEMYERILRLSPLDIEMKIRVAELSEKSGQSKRASQGYSVIASDFYDKGEFETAKGFYEKAIGIDQNNSTALVGLSKLADRTGDLEKALDFLNRALSTKPDERTIHLRYARLSMKAHKTAEAKQALKKLIEKDGTDLDARKLLGILYIDEGLMDDAWEELSPCIDAEIEENNWANALAMLNNFDEIDSIPVKQRLVNIYRGKGETANLSSEITELAQLHENKGSHADALQCYKEAQAIEPENQDLKKRISELEEMLAGPVDSHVPDSDTRHNTYAPDGVQNSEEHDIMGSNETEGMSPQYIDAKKTEADFYAQQGLHDEARKVYEELLASCPHDEEIKNALDALNTSAVAPEEKYDRKHYSSDKQVDINLAMNEILQDIRPDHRSPDNGIEDSVEEAQDTPVQFDDDGIAEAREALVKPGLKKNRISYL